MKPNNDQKTIKEDLIPVKYKTANQKFRKLINNPPDLKTSEPIELYNWLKSIIDLTKIK